MTRSWFDWLFTWDGFWTLLLVYVLLETSLRSIANQLRIERLERRMLEEEKKNGLVGS